MKFLSLLKAGLSFDMNLFKYSTKRNSSKLSKVMLPIILFSIICISIGGYCYMIAEQLAPFNLTYIMLSMFIILVTFLTFIEGIYKSQGILFEAKDNDLLFSLPIKKYQILMLRIFKLMIFQYLYNLMFLLPAFVVYIYFEHPGINFYILAFLMTILIPIIPTIVSSFFGYAIKLIASKFKAKKIIQTLLSASIFLGIFYLSSNLENFISNIVEKATSINDMLIKIYYPIGLFVKLINEFNIIDFMKLIAINFIPFIIFIIIGQKYYFKIISNSKIKSNMRKRSKIKIIKRNKITALIIKELKRYFSSVVYMFNTSFGLIICIVGTIILSLQGKEAFNTIFEQYGISADLSITVLFYFFVLFVGLMTSITSSSISLEGKTINITKSLPVKEKEILISKILTCYVIELPVLVISDIIFIIRFQPSIVYSFLIVALSFIIILLSACIGLISNLKYPKMNASSDTEVVKQSMSSMISVFSGMGIFIGSALLTGYLSQFVNLNFLVGINFGIITIITLILYVVLMKIGKAEYRKINA